MLASLYWNTRTYWRNIKISMQTSARTQLRARMGALGKVLADGRQAL